jgi:hypothetical protein
MLTLQKKLVFTRFFLGKICLSMENFILKSTIILFLIVIIVKSYRFLNQKIFNNEILSELTACY